jgi:release factor glutamine methyltransferase
MSRQPAAVAPSWRKLWRSTERRISDPVQARWLLEEASGVDGAALLSALDDEAPPPAAARLESLVQRRLAGEPLQHVLGHWGFRTLEVAVDSRVLIPRPETEAVVTLALLELDRHRRPEPGGAALAVDLGTGSGVIALSLVAERAEVRVIATDRSAGALEVAVANRSRLSAGVSARLQFRQGDWYQALPGEVLGQVDLIVANPPYVAEHEWPGLDAVVRDFDPLEALVSGPSGLEAIETIVSGAPEWLGRPGALVVEIAPSQAGAAVELAHGAGFAAAAVEDDDAGRPRVLVARR